MIDRRVAVTVLAACACAATLVSADHYATKQDYRLGKLTPSSYPQTRAGGDDCGSAAPIAAVPFNDTGDTTGATDSVAQIPLECNGNYAVVPGPDHIYSFTVTAGNDLTFSLVTSSEDYDPSIWTASVCGDGTSCVTGAAADNCFAANHPSNPCNGTSDESFTNSFAPGTYYFYVDSFYITPLPPNPGMRHSGPYSLTVTGSLPVQLLRFDVE